MSNEPNKQQSFLLRAALKIEIARLSDEIALTETEEGERSPDLSAVPAPALLAEEMMKADIKTSQVRNLETIAYTSDKISDITDLLKKVVGRDTKSEHWGKGQVGKRIIQALEELRKTARTIASALKQRYPQAFDDDLARRVHLALCREYIKHLAAHYLYQKPAVEE